MSLLRVLLCAVTMMLAFSISPVKLASTFNKSDQLSSDNYPTIEIYCYVEDFPDRMSYGLYKPSIDMINRYVASFWKTVDHYFRMLGIRIKLTGIDIKKPDFLSHHGVVYSSQVSNLGLSTEGRKEDIIVVISRFPVCAESVITEIQCESFVPFITVTNKNVCAVDKPVVMIRDQGLYQGIRGAILSIGSLLGAVPDGSPGAENCLASDGYFMSPSIHFDFPYKFSWSDCSKKMIQNFVKSSEAYCLHSNDMITPYNFSGYHFPGELISLDDFCKGLKRKIVNNYNNLRTTNWNSINICSELICEYEGGLEIKGPPLEGSWCADGKRCRYGKCVQFPF